jgi:hypothetical protein
MHNSDHLTHEPPSAGKTTSSRVPSEHGALETAGHLDERSGSEAPPWRPCSTTVCAHFGSWPAALAATDLSYTAGAARADIDQ